VKGGEEEGEKGGRGWQECRRRAEKLAGREGMEEKRNHI
jgi:hypothetical protein